MNKAYVIAQHFLFGMLILVGGILFLWFLWPAVFKGIMNMGNCCGMLGSFLLIFYGIRHRNIHQFLINMWQGKFTRVCLGVFTGFVLIGFGLALAASIAIIRSASHTIPEHTPAVVLGCAVKGTVPSRVLQERIDAAYAYMQKDAQAVCILSGGKGKGEDISEAECMYRELTKAGIDANRLYMETESTNTQENLENTKKILEQLDVKDAVTVISSDFHLYRGRWWAKKIGYQNYGYAAHTDRRYLPTFFLREVIAVVHLWLVSLL